MNVAHSPNITAPRCGLIRPLAWTFLAALHVCAFALANAQSRSNPEATSQESTTVIAHGEQVSDEIRFEAIDVFVDTGNDALAAYQFELISESQGVEIVGIEGGEHTAFSEPPYYDARAMMGNRVILGAFSTDTRLPSGRSRVARIHLQLDGSGPREYRTTLSVSANSDGDQVPAEIEIVKAKA